jgi:hypothetical protein
VLCIVAEVVEDVEDVDVVGIIGTVGDGHVDPVLTGSHGGNSSWGGGAERENLFDDIAFSLSQWNRMLVHT